MLNMPKYGIKSTANLQGVHPKLQALFQEVVRYFDNSILGGARTIEQQRKNVADGLSQTMNSKHLPQADGLSHAVDAAPYPQHWDDVLGARKTFTDWETQLIYFGGFVKGIAAARGIPLRYGGDFNRNNDVMDSGFRDLDHFELEDDA